MLNKYILPVITAFAFYACSDSPGNRDISERKDGYTKTLVTREDSLFNDVMQGHDIGMAKMGKLSRSIVATKARLDSLSSSGSNPSKAYKDSLTLLLENLQQADAGMYLWMEEFKRDSAKDNPTLRIQYLESEKVKVEKVRDRILESLRRGDSILAK